ncbi:GNAT family N-acetyltransferase [Actinophytocola sp. KF-1]
MTTRRASRIAELAADWRTALPHRSILTTPEWLATDEEGRRDEGRYVLAGDAGLVAQRVAAGTFPTNDPIALLLSGDVDEATDPAAYAEITAMRARLAGRLTAAGYPVATATLPSGYLPGVVGDPAAFPAMLDELAAAARDWDCPVTAVPHVPDGDLLTGLLTDRGYLGFAALAQAELALDPAWRDFDAYLAALPKRRRNTVRRERREFAGAGMVVREDRLGERKAEMARLHTEQLRRHGHEIPDEVMHGLLDRIERHLAPWCRVLVAERDGALEAFALCYAHSGELHVKMAGLSADAQRHFGYFAVCYYEVIAYALRARLRTVVFGPLTYQAKVARGCGLAPRSTYVRVPAGLTGEVTELAALLDRHHRATFARLGGVT